MTYNCQNCTICGSDKIKCIDSYEKSGNIFHTYSCKSCDGEFSSEILFLCKQKKDAPVSSSTELSAKDIFKNNSAAIIEIKCAFEDCIAVGTGISLEGGLILTNAHILFDQTDEDSLLNISDNIVGKVCGDSELFDLELLQADKENDIALLQTEKTLPCLSICEQTVATGEKIYVIGNSKGQGIGILEGLISDSKRIVAGKEFLLISAPVTGGNSGCPVFNTSGDVIGMVAKGRKDAIAMNYAIPSSKIIEFLKNNLRISPDFCNYPRMK